MEDTIVSFETAKKLKEIGFNIPTDGSYYWDYEWKHSKKGAVKTVNSVDKYSYATPTQSLVQKYLREVHNIEVKVWAEHYSTGTNWNVQALKFDLSSEWPDFIVSGSMSLGDNGEYNTYEEALERGLIEGLNSIAAKIR